MNLLITICARGGSKGIPGKNIHPLHGEPLIGYSIEHAKKYAQKTGADIALSTDDAEINKVAAEFSLHSDYVRPSDLSTDSAGKLPVIAALLEYEEKSRGKIYDLILDLDVSSPMRTINDLEEAQKMIEARADALNLFSVSPARRNPYFNMVEVGKDGFAHLCKKPAAEVQSRQSAPKVYDLNASFYYYRRAFFAPKRALTLVENSLAYVMPHECFDLDHTVDFEFLEYLLRQKKLSFSLV